MPKNVAQKLIESHLAKGTMEVGEEIGLKIAPVVRFVWPSRVYPWNCERNGQTDGALVCQGRYWTAGTFSAP